MKTKELIRLLEKEDPDGETEVCVANLPIFYVTRDPAYWDGALQVLRYQDGAKGYNIASAAFVREGEKVVIHTWSIEDAIWEDPDLAVDDAGGRYREAVERWRAEAKEGREGDD